MTIVVTRSPAEILRLTEAQWAGEPQYLEGFLADLTGVSSPPTASSVMSAWLEYTLTNPFTPGGGEGYEPFVFLPDVTFSYNTTLNRAESEPITFNFGELIDEEFDIFTSTTVTHVVIGGFFDLDKNTTPPQAVLQLASPITLTSSSTLSYNIRLFGRAA
jgi:hypothetical protein